MHVTSIAESGIRVEYVCWIPRQSLWPPSRIFGMRSGCQILSPQRMKVDVDWPNIRLRFNKLLQSFKPSQLRCQTVSTPNFRPATVFSCLEDIDLARQSAWNPQNHRFPGICTLFADTILPRDHLDAFP